MAGGYFELLELLHQERLQDLLVDLQALRRPRDGAARGRGPAAAPPDVRQRPRERTGSLQAACKEKNGLKILAVTVLTSLDRADLRDLGFECEPRDLVLSRAKRAARHRLRRGDLAAASRPPALRGSLGASSSS